MALETASNISQLNPSNPGGSDRLQQGDDHIRLIKAALKATFPNITGPMTATHTFLNSVGQYLLPIGSILLWTGSSIPAGFVLCDGKYWPRSDGAGTIFAPNLTGRVPVGASSDYGLNSTFGQATKTVTTSGAGGHSHSGGTSAAGDHSHGGNTQGHTLTEGEMPSHRHYGVADGQSTVSVTSSTHLALLKNDSGDTSYRLCGVGNEANLAPSSATGGSGSHSHPISNDGSHTHGVSIDGVGDHAHGVTIDVTQPSYSVNFIMKI